MLRKWELMKLLAAGGGTDGGAGTATQEPPKTTPAPEGAISLTPGQLEERVQRAADAAKRKYESDLKAAGRLLDETESTDYAEYRKTQREAEEAKARKSGDDALKRFNDEKESLKKQAEAEKSELTKQLNSTRIENKVAIALSSYSYAESVKSDQVKKLVMAENAFGIEDGEVVVLDERGAPRYSDINPNKLMEPSEFIDKLLQNDMKWALAPKGTSGSGGSPLRGQSQVRIPANWKDPAVYRALPQEVRDELAKQNGFGEENKPKNIFERPKRETS